MTKRTSRICVYCASSNQTPDIYKTAASELGKIIARAGWTLVYGGGARGLMGSLADSALEHGGAVIGIIPEFMLNLEWGHQKLTELTVVETMSQRKHKMIRNSDGVIALPGGTGTLEELMEAISLKRLGLYTKPIIIVNTNGFYDHLLSFLKNAIVNGFLHDRHQEIWQTVDTPYEIVEIINNPPEWSEDAIHFAAV